MGGCLRGDGGGGRCGSTRLCHRRGLLLRFSSMLMRAALPLPAHHTRSPSQTGPRATWHAPLTSHKLLMLNISLKHTPLSNHPSLPNHLRSHSGPHSAWHAPLISLHSAVHTPAYPQHLSKNISRYFPFFPDISGCLTHSRCPTSSPYVQPSRSAHPSPSAKSLDRHLP